MRFYFYCKKIRSGKVVDLVLILHPIQILYITTTKMIMMIQHANEQYKNIFSEKNLTGSLKGRMSIVKNEEKFDSK